MLYKKKKHRTFYTNQLGSILVRIINHLRRKTFMTFCLLFYISQSGANFVTDEPLSRHSMVDHGTMGDTLESCRSEFKSRFCANYM